MKKLLILLISVMFILTGCKNDLIGEESDVKVDKSDVEFTLVKDSLTNTGASCILKNNSDKTLYYGTPWEIEIYDEGTWKKMDVEMVFNMPLMELKSRKEIKLNFDWEHSHGKLKGKYRIIKDVYFENEEKFFIACEFEV